MMILYLSMKDSYLHFFVFQKLVIQKVMPIFTFVSNNLLLQDDSHSFKVISDLLVNILPPMIKVSYFVFITLSKVIENCLHKLFTQSAWIYMPAVWRSTAGCIVGIVFPWCRRRIYYRKSVHSALPS